MIYNPKYVHMIRNIMQFSYELLYVAIDEARISRAKVSFQKRSDYITICNAVTTIQTPIILSSHWLTALLYLP